jgi:hypothetical protein
MISSQNMVLSAERPYTGSSAITMVSLAEKPTTAFTAAAAVWFVRTRHSSVVETPVLIAVDRGFASGCEELLCQLKSLVLLLTLSETLCPTDARAIPFQRRELPNSE